MELVPNVEPVVTSVLMLPTVTDVPLVSSHPMTSVVMPSVVNVVLPTVKLVPQLISV